MRWTWAEVGKKVGWARLGVAGTGVKRGWLGQGWGWPRCWLARAGASKVRVDMDLHGHGLGWARAGASKIVVPCASFTYVAALFRVMCVVTLWSRMGLGRFKPSEISERSQVA